MAQAVSKPVITTEMLTKEELAKIRSGLSPWPNTSAPERPDVPVQSENKRAAG